VAILCHNSVLVLRGAVRCGKVGAILVPLNWRQTRRSWRHPGRTVRPVLLHDAATARLPAALAKAGEARLVGFDAWEKLIARARPTPARDTAWNTDRVWYLLYTSGTTGRPQGRESRPSAWRSPHYQRAAGGGPHGRRPLGQLPALFHTAASICTPCRCSSRRQQHRARQVEVDPLLDLIRRGRVSILFRRARHQPGDQLSPRFAGRRPDARAPLGLRRPSLPESLIRAFLPGRARVHGMA